MKFNFKKIGNYFLGFLKLLWEIILFILTLPTYIRHILRGLRTIGEAYDVILKMEENIVKELKKYNLRDNLENSEVLQIISGKLEEILKLEKERWEKFNQLFSNFIAIFALIVSICALIFSLRN